MRDWSKYMPKYRITLQTIFEFVGSAERFAASIFTIIFPVCFVAASAGVAAAGEARSRLCGFDGPGATLSGSAWMAELKPKTQASAANE
ncbi:hypothetical protein Ms3S1_01260 [Methylosinus sp. 3S-1]